jgi:hypothetical protein
VELDVVAAAVIEDRRLAPAIEHHVVPGLQAAGLID